MRRYAPGAGKTAFFVILRKKEDAAYEAVDGAGAVCLTPCAGLAQETVEADFEGGHWLYEDTAQGVRVEIVRHEDTENRVL